MGFSLQNLQNYRENAKYKNVPKTNFSEQSCSLNIFKKFEEEVRGKSLLGNNHIFPVWFHAETEVNIFLWRNGFSLEDKKEFDFWLNPTEMIKKLKNKNFINAKTENILFNFNFLELEQLDQSENNQSINKCEEIEYYENFLNILKITLEHIHALSIIQRDVGAGLNTNEVVVIPV